MIPADVQMMIVFAVVKAVFWTTLAVLAVALVWLVLRWAGRAVARKRARQVETHGGVWTGKCGSGYPWGQPIEPDDCGDQGGRPVTRRAGDTPEATERGD